MEKQYLFTGSLDLEHASQKILQQLEVWINSSELANIVSSFGGSLPADLTLEGKISWLLEFSDRWDYRKKQKTQDKATGENARWKVSNENITTEQEKAVHDAVFRLGLIGVQVPECKSFDYILVLGGARFSCLYRSQYVEDLLKNGTVKTKEIILLSGMRPVLDSEREATDTYAPQALTEYDLINSGAESSLHLKKDFYEERYHSENINLNWAIRKYQTEDSVTVTSYSGPSSEPEIRRANSSDTYKFFLEKKNVQTGSRLLLVRA